MRPAFVTLQEQFPQIRKTVDATAPLVVNVTEADCKNGDRKNIAGCALAQALRREHKADGALVNVTTAYLIKKSIAYRYLLPASISREIVVFDRTKSAKTAFKPGEYRLSSVPPSLRLERMRKYGKEKPRGRTTTSVRAQTKEASATTNSYRHRTTGLRTGAIRTK